LASEVLALFHLSGMCFLGVRLGGCHNGMRFSKVTFKLYLERRGEKQNAAIHPLLLSDRIEIYEPNPTIMRKGLITRAISCAIRWQMRFSVRHGIMTVYT
jgi:hypothetical protein